MATQAPSSGLDHAPWAPVVTEDDWFEMRDLGDGVHLIAEPGHVNCFLVTGQSAALLFDSGMGIGLISAAVARLTELPLLVVNSHDHLDHRGGNADLVQHAAEYGLLGVAAHPRGISDGHRAVPERFLQAYAAAMRGVHADYTDYARLDSQSFFAADRLPRMRPMPDLATWRVPALAPTRALDDGEEIDLGGRTLTVIHSPGHAPDGICLYEHASGLLLAGDTLLAAAHWLHGDGADLGAFAATTARLAELPVSRVLTAHNLVSQRPASHVTEVARAARVVLSGESIPQPGTDLLGHRVARHEVDGVVILTPATSGELSTLQTAAKGGQVSRSGGGEIVLGRESDRPVRAGVSIRLISGVRCPDGSLGDIVIDDGRIVAVREHGTGDDDGSGIVDARGWRALPAAAEPHAHLDKALSAARVDVRHNNLDAAITQWRALLPTIDAADIYERAHAAVQRYVSRGITSIRTHVDLPRAGDPLRGVDALTRLRDELRGTVTLQLVALVAPETSDGVVEAAIERGVDILGGCPHLAPEPRRETTRLLDIAERHRLPVDLHTDEQISADHVDLVDLAQQVLSRGLTQQVTASHCVRLGSLPPARLAPVLASVRHAGVGIVTLPITNLYLQGRDATHLAPRGLPALRAILDAGIPLAAGGDNLRDPFNPVGRADPFETTSLLVTAGHLTPAEALDLVTTGARTVMGLPQVGIAAGRAADLILVPDTDLGDVLAGHVDARIVVHAGRIICDTRVAQSLDLTIPLIAGPIAAADPTSAHRVRR